MADGTDREPLRIGDSLKECEEVLPSTPSSGCGLLEATRGDQSLLGRGISG
jgi:hypothetical protein